MMPHRLIVNGELVLHGPVGFVDMFGEGDGFTVTDVMKALADLDGDITVKLNSGGGVAWDGTAIHNALKDHDGKVTVFVQGVAASAASIIAMAGDEIVMQEGALMMIHNSSGLTLGTKEDHAKTGELLGTIDQQAASMYAARGSFSAAKFTEMMNAETWLTGTDAVEAGLADRTIGDESSQPSAFLYELYQHAPAALKSAGLLSRDDAVIGKFAHKVSSSIGRELAAKSAAEPVEDGKEPEMTTLEAGKADIPKQTAEITMETLQESNPDILAQIRADAATAERERLEGIDAVSFPGQEKLAEELKADGKTTPEQAAVIFNKAEKEKGAVHLKALESADKEIEVAAAPTQDGGNGDELAAMPEGEEKWKAQYAADPKVKNEFTSEATYVAYMKAASKGRVKILGSRAA